MIRLQCRNARWPAWKIQSTLIARRCLSSRYSEIVASHLAEFRAFDRRKILDQIDSQLSHQPTAETRNKKKLEGLVPPWEHVEPVWELRVGDVRAVARNSGS